MQFLDKIVWRIVDAVLLVAVLGMVALIALQVGSRISGASIPWTEELSRFCFIWTIWLGLAAGFRNGRHPAVTILPDLIGNPAIRRSLAILPAIAAALLFAIVTSHGWDLLNQQIRFGEKSAILQIGMWIATVPIVLGSALSVIGAIVHALSGTQDHPAPPVAPPVAPSGDPS